MESEVLVPTGTGQDAGTSSLIRRKLIECCGHAGIKPADASSLLASLDTLPSVPDAVPLFRSLSSIAPERADGRETVYPELIGPIIYRREIKQLAGDFLAEYRVVQIDVDLSPPRLATRGGVVTAPTGRGCGKS